MPRTLIPTDNAKQISQVVREYVQIGDMTYSESKDLAAGVLYQNSNKLYRLSLPQHRSRGYESPSDLDRHSIRAQPDVNDPLQVLESYFPRYRSIQDLGVYWSDMTGTTRTRGTYVDYASAEEHGRVLPTYHHDISGAPPDRHRSTQPPPSRPVKVYFD
ncbi:hypothetical protein VUR80DRAFT_2216 [Thermomyces stellatus]